MSFNSDFSVFRSDFAIAVKHLEEKHGIKIKIGGITYASDSFTTKLSAVEVKAGDEGLTVEEIAWNKNCERYGFDKDDLGKTFIDGGKSYKIAGWNDRSNKYKVLLKSGNKTIRGTVGLVKSGLKK